AIMKLFASYLKQGIKEMTEQNTKVTFLGDKSPFPEAPRALMERLERDSVGNKYRLNVAVNYGGRAEIVNAVNRLAARGVTEFSEELIESELYTKGQDDPDLIVRSAGEMRLSNFLTWQSVYSEFYFSDTLWPDFGEADVDAAVDAYYHRVRRFGGVV
ncbi:MAG: di-trans,poly-cis-decaprenylcistransferase, partial [Clostridia bacterium]|nr:di-trans,poly-cis-decaprenylcistransferase [Clostridia bacterium]